MSGLGIPEYVLLQFGSQGMSWLFFVLALMWCSFTWWKTQKSRAALAILITSGATLTSILVILGLWVFAMFSFRSSGPSPANIDLIEALLIVIFVILTLSWITCSIFFFSLGSHWRKTPDPQPNQPLHPSPSSEQG